MNVVKFVVVEGQPISEAERNNGENDTSMRKGIACPVHVAVHPFYAVGKVRFQCADGQLDVDHVESHLEEDSALRHNGSCTMAHTNVVSGHILAADTTQRPS